MTYAFPFKNKEVSFSYFCLNCNYLKKFYYLLHVNVMLKLSLFDYFVNKNYNTKELLCHY